MNPKQRMRLETAARLVKEPPDEVIDSALHILLRLEGQKPRSTEETRTLRAEVIMLQYEARSRGSLLQANAFADAMSSSGSEDSKPIDRSSGDRPLVPRPGGLYSQEWQVVVVEQE